MGFIGNLWGTSLSQREMGTRDFIWLAVLGTAARGPAGIEDFCHAIDVITIGQWLPVGELVCASVDEMLRGGHLELMGAGDNRLVPTERGRETLALLLGQPIARPTSVLGQVGLRLKLAFLDLLEGLERRAVLDGLIGQYDEELSRRQQGEEFCPVRGSFGELWRGHDLERVRRDVALLRSMTGMAAESPAFRH